MENKNNGQGIFYVVIGVATLVVTIIGATFAYFSASNQSTADAVAANSTTISLGYSDNKTGIKRNLIPMNEANASFKNVPGLGTTDCKDINNNDICSTYEFTVTNPSTTTAQRIYVTLTPTTNTFTNLNYAIFKGSAAAVKEATDKFDVTKAVVSASSLETGTTATEHRIGNTGALVAKGQFTLNSKTAITLENLEQVLGTTSGKNSVTYTIVLWIHETGGDQTTADAGKEFAGQINVTTASGGTGVTGVLS